MDDDPRAAEQPRGAQRQKVRIARPRADKVDCADFHPAHMCANPENRQ
jgi:hypothetical protein